MANERTVDFISVGSGGGSMCAGLYLRSIGKEPLILEKTDKVGGSTAMSGGVLWLPNNPIMKREGIEDSYEKAQTYLEATVGPDAGPASSPERRHAFLTYGPKIVEFLQTQGLIFQRPAGYSDYYDDRAGGVPESRCLIVPLFNLAELGSWHHRLRRLPAFAMPLAINEFNPLALVKKTMKGKLMALTLAWRFFKQKLLGQDWVGCGCAIQGRMLQASLKHNVPIETDIKVKEFLLDGDRVVGVLAEQNGQDIKIFARNGVLINAGGFSHNAEMRQKYGPQPASTEWTNSNPGDTGEVIQAAMALGAAVDLMDQAWWTPVSNPPFDLGMKPIQVTDLAKPHSIMVGADGQRFCDESASYMEVGQSMYARHKVVQAVPSYMVIDSQNRADYPMYIAPPGITPKEWIESGYVKKADTLDDLARQCGVDPAGLKATVERFNGFARTGVDEDFHRGRRQWDNWYGDPTNKPSSTLGALEKGPFYAVAVYPGDVGTAGGLMTDEHARVLREDGSVINGLYATGNSTASVMGRCYPGAGASIAASFIFGYIAAEHAALRN